MEILSIYLRRWSIEVVFKDLKQNFGFYQSKSSKYAPQIGDLNIRCIPALWQYGHYASTLGIFALFLDCHKTEWISSRIPVAFLP